MFSIRLTTPLALLSALAACTPDGGPPAATSPTPAAPNASAVQQAARDYRVHYNTPVDLDSTDYYYQPVSVLSQDGSSPSRTYDSGSSYGSSSEGRSGIEGTCYNVLFLRKSGPAEQRLLLPHGRFVLTSIDDERQPDSRWPYLFYTVVKADTNADQEQDEEDATTLFASDRSGQHLRQLTPDGTQLQSRHYLPPTSLLLVEVRPDTNHDQEFTAADAPYWLRYDLRNLSAPPTRTPTPALGGQLHRQMLQRQTSPAH
ncbi:hypothetical protein K3G63_16015 [Hymenobacter sp. HSC-4F20]|uniref:hypothetical protein n=1 Tax=Hymenobacter sp. HSC-4F20 TaxID=2864135 RepID=UPI001C7331D5|nr:hypothetical protein [Hymenobacter sp. HSC-4F20]MBX0291959.1 hypothetical protein [Hymenobacter sp. HSC-4F20]